MGKEALGPKRRYKIFKHSTNRITYNQLLQEFAKEWCCNSQNSNIACKANYVTITIQQNSQKTSFICRGKNAIGSTVEDLLNLITRLKPFFVNEEVEKICMKRQNQWISIMRRREVVNSGDHILIITKPVIERKKAISKPKRMNNVI